MPKIRILPEQLANQIAAGEVIERPASVVKELVENSLDAGSDRIEVNIEGGGTRLIQVIDNGEGMDEDDLLLSLERHGTSKIREEHDLGAIATLGFRGEAMPSIGSVSKLTIVSRTKAHDLGTRVELSYGKLVKVHETGCQFGTTVEVRNLFGNTPARRKFLRTNRTEIGHIDEVLKNYGLAYPDKTFILRIDNRESLYLDTSLSESQRLAAVMNYRSSFIPVDKSGPKTDGKSRHKLHGFLVPPEKLTAAQARLRLFVNGRAVRDRMLMHAVGEGLRGFLMKGRTPAGLLHLELPPDEIDVNVHPAKHEIRFRQSREVHLLVSQAVTEAMAGYQQKLRSELFGTGYADRQPVPLDSNGPEPEWVRQPVPDDESQFSAQRFPDIEEKLGEADSSAECTREAGNPLKAHPKVVTQDAKADADTNVDANVNATVDGEKNFAASVATENLSIRATTQQSTASAGQRHTSSAKTFAPAQPPRPLPHMDRPLPRPVSRSSADGKETPSRQPSYAHTRETTPENLSPASISGSPLQARATTTPNAETGNSRTEETAPSRQTQPHPKQHGLLVIGQFDDLYIFCKSSQGLLVIDQHAAHERLLYEKLRRQYTGGRMVRQNLLFPVTVELTIFQSQLVEKNMEELEKIGFSLRDFGANTFVINAVPAIGSKLEPRELFYDVLEHFGSERKRGDHSGYIDTILATMACKAAVKAGTSLSELEIDKLLNEMAAADMFSHCPHGRPVVKQFSKEEVKKWFYRG